MTPEEASAKDVPEVFRWPTMPSRPHPGGILLVRMDATAARPEMRRLAREAIRRILRAWDMPRAALRETDRAPEIRDPDGGNACVSLAYAGSSIWIGLRLDGKIGVDAMTPTKFDGIEQVARDYLRPEDVAHIAGSDDQAAAFARAWTRHEARLKHAGVGLTEHKAAAHPPGTTTTFEHERFVVSVAW